MKVYVIWYDNGESYEDNFQCIDRIFSTRELAEEYLDKHYKRVGPNEFSSWRQETYWVEPLYKCSEGKEEHYDCYECPKFEDPDKCSEAEKLYENDYSAEVSYSIKEFPLLESVREGDKFEEVIQAKQTSSLYNGIGTIKLNSKYVNSKITYNILSDEEMLSAGFTKTQDGGWYFCRRLKNDGVEDRDASITLNITLPVPIDNDKLDISVLDEAFLQPYDFQSILRANPKHKYALEVSEQFEEEMEKMKNKGIILGHERYEYV